MDRRSWLWRRKSSEKSPGETESSGSLSSHSERFSDEQEVSKVSPNRIQSPEVSSNISGGEVHDNVKSLTQKLSAALSNINAKEELVKQHAKVAEEAVSGWEKAETEVVALKQQLEAATKKNSPLEDRVGHLDGALKECVRQLRQAREEHEKRIHEATIKKTREWESAKFKFEKQLTELQTQLQSANTAAAAAASVEHDLQLKLEAAVKENSVLKLELSTQAEEVKVRTLERELSTRAAETASKQHLESTKKVAKLEAECRKLQAAARKVSSVNDHKSIVASIYVGSLTDSQSDSGERLLAVETDLHKMGGVESNEYEPSCSDSWASALIAEFDQFKNEKAISKNFSVVSPDIDLMDDFLEMERLASLADMSKNGCGSELAVITDCVNSDNSKQSELEILIQKTAELEEKLQKLEGEKAGLELALTERQDQFETSRSQLMETEQKLVELRRQLTSTNESMQAVEVELEAANAMRKDMESQLEAMDVEVQTLRARVGSLELEMKDERALSKEIGTKWRNLEDELSRKKHETELPKAVSSNGDLKIKQEKELAMAAGKLAECQKTIASLGQQLKALATLEDFLLDSDMPDLNEVSPALGELKKPYSNDAYFSKEVEPPNTIDENSLSNGKDKELPPSSLSSSSTNHDSEKSRNGFRKLFSRSKNGSNRIENQ